jgi:hypothetical protein
MKFKGDLIIADPAMFIPEEDWDDFVEYDGHPKLKNYLCKEADDGLVKVCQTNFDPEIIRNFLISVKRYMDEVFEPEDNFDKYEVDKRITEIYDSALLENAGKESGKVPVESGQIGIFSLSEVLSIAPDFKDGVIINDFKGDIRTYTDWYGNSYFIGVGNGYSNFFTI